MTTWRDHFSIPRCTDYGWPTEQPRGGKGGYGRWGDETTVTCRCERSEA